MGETIKDPREITPVQVVLADPPWTYAGTLSGSAKPTNMVCPYPTLTVAEMIAQRPCTTDDAVCFMWTTGTHIPDALQLLHGWGFAYVNVAFVWDKGRTMPGAYTLSQTEFVLLGKRGQSSRVLRLFTTRVRQFVPPDGIRRRHSQKPDDIYERIETLARPNVLKLEMYARRLRPGWLAFGNQLAAGGGGTHDESGGDDDRCAPEELGYDTGEHPGIPRPSVPDVPVHVRSASLCPGPLKETVCYQSSG